MTTKTLERRVSRLECTTRPPDWSGWSDAEMRRFLTLTSRYAQDILTDDEALELARLKQRVPQYSGPNNNLDALTDDELRRGIVLGAQSAEGGLTEAEQRE
jgi:hypothetical protein